MIHSIVLLVLFAQSIADTYNAANADMEAKRWAEAAVKYEQVLEEDAAHIPTMFQLAVCYTNIGNIERATELYAKVLEQDGNIYEARVNFALLLEKSGELAQALEHIEKAIALRPDDPNVYSTAAFLATASGELDRAYSYMVGAEQKGLRTVELYVALSEAEARRNDQTKSLQYLEQAAGLDPSNRSLQRQLGIAYHKAEQFEKAIATLKPLLPETRLQLAVSYASNKNYAEAAELFTELVRLEPSNADYLFMLGKANLETRRYVEAVAPLTRALELKPNDLEARWTLGYALYLQEDWSRAIPVLLKFVESEPQHAFVHFLLATSFDNLENLENAIVHYNRFLELDNGSDDVRSFQARQRARTLERRLAR